ncbi:MAG: hypothetical protein WBX26_06935 [Candidatus Cybelea sp.]
MRSQEASVVEAAVLTSGRIIRAALLGGIASIFAACSQAATPQVPAGYPVSTTSVAKEYQAPSVPIYALADRLSKNGYHAPEIIVYGAPSASGPMVIPLTGLYAPSRIAIDAQQTVYVADYGKDGNEHLETSVTEWNTKHSGAIRKITAGIAYPIAIALTSAGLLYVANDFGGKAGTVTVYLKKSLRPSRTITKGIKAPSAVAVDASGYAYVANPGVCYPGCANKVTEYPPKADVPSVVATQGLEYPFALAIDSSEHLYAASIPWVTEYEAHSATLIRKLSLGTGWEINTVALDSLGDVYVAARRTVGSDWFGEIVEFGPTGNKPKRRITFSVGVVPESMVTDRYANLYSVTTSFSGACTGSRCALLEFPNGQKGRVVIAESNRTTGIGGPIAVAP